MKRGLILLLVGAFLVGCGNSGDVSADDTRSKEQQMEEATKKLNGGQAPGDQQPE
jgi:hypothetical protein